MIAKLTGLLDTIGADRAVIDVGGVGYLAFCSARTLGQLGATGTRARLFVETHVREDHIHLYGFIDEAEREAFRLLTTVQGVGARVALAILSVLTPDKLTLAVVAQDKAALTQADGVGPKLAARILSELKAKVGGLSIGPVAGDPIIVGDLPNASPAASDAISALVNLGYRRAEAFGAVAAASHHLGPEAAVPDLIRAGLKELSA